jgi:imidazolonepropionase-like amidohydrolase
MKIRWLLASCWLLPFSAIAGSLVISPVNVLSVATGNITENRAVIVNEAMITGIVATADAPLADADTVVIDGNGGWLIPGLAEMHAHIPPKRRGEQYARDILTLFLANGVTTVRGMLGEPWHLELRGLLQTGEWEGPRLITSGPSFNGNSVTSPAQAAQRVLEQAAAGYDFLKLHPGLEPEEFMAIAGTAREAGIPFAGHVSYAVGLDAALRAGQATIDHLDGYAEAMVPADSQFAATAPSWFGLNLALEMEPHRAPALAVSTALAGVWNVPTQSLFETTAGVLTNEELLARPGMEYLSPELRSDWLRRMEDLRAGFSPAQRRAFIEARRALIRALQDARAGLLLGSDAPQIMNVPGFSVHQELQHLVTAGLTPLQALQAGTVNVARFFGHADQGEVVAGYVADFILLRNNPLQDIGATMGIEGVMRDGRWYGRDRLDRMLAEVRQRGI